MYMELINLDVSSKVLSEIFAVNRPMIQFKEQALLLDATSASDYLEKLDEEQSLTLIDQRVFLEGPITNNLVQPVGTQKNIVRSDPSIKELKALADQIDSRHHSPREGFEYSVENYSYDSLSLTVVSQTQGFLYWADGYDKDWHAYIDGKEVPLKEAWIGKKTVLVFIRHFG